MDAIEVSSFTGRRDLEDLYSSSFFTLDQGKRSSIQNYY